MMPSYDVRLAWSRWLFLVTLGASHCRAPLRDRPEVVDSRQLSCAAHVGTSLEVGIFFW
jgi:hypothetical protein